MESVAAVAAAVVVVVVVGLAVSVSKLPVQLAESKWLIVAVADLLHVGETWPANLGSTVTVALTSKWPIVILPPDNTRARSPQLTWFSLTPNVC